MREETVAHVVTALTAIADRAAMVPAEGAEAGPKALIIEEAEVKAAVAVADVEPGLAEQTSLCRMNRAGLHMLIAAETMAADRAETVEAAEMGPEEAVAVEVMAQDAAVGAAAMVPEEVGVAAAMAAARAVEAVAGVKIGAVAAVEMMGVVHAEAVETTIGVGAAAIGMDSAMAVGRRAVDIATGSATAAGPHAVDIATGSVMAIGRRVAAIAKVIVMLVGIRGATIAALTAGVM